MREDQIMLSESLRAFTGALPPGYASEKEFFITSLMNMEEHLAGLQRETLAGTCAAFLRRLEAGRAGHKEIEDFKASVDHLISNEDFRLVSAAMAGSAGFIKQRLAGLKPVSLLAALKRGRAGMPADALRRVDSAYARLDFPAMVRQVEARRSDLAADRALAGGRAAVGEYCAVYRIQLSGEATLTPFSMALVDSALAAALQLYKDVCRASGRGS